MEGWSHFHWSFGQSNNGCLYWRAIKRYISCASDHKANTSSQIKREGYKEADSSTSCLDLGLQTPVPTVTYLWWEVSEWQYPRALWMAICTGGLVSHCCPSCFLAPTLAVKYHTLQILVCKDLRQGNHAFLPVLDCLKSSKLRTTLWDQTIGRWRHVFRLEK